MDVGPVRAYLANLKAQGTPVTLQALLAGAIGRTYARFPAANASVVGDTIVHFPDVGIFAPIDLSTKGGAIETGMVILENANSRPLLDLAARAKKTVEGERQGDRDNGFLRRAIPLAEKIPPPLFTFALDAIDRVARTELAARALRKAIPATVGLSNLGATLAMPAGGLVRGASMSFPDKLLAIGSLFGVGPIQDEVVAVDGAPAVRPMLPVIYVFDHRLFDGVYAGRILSRFTEILRDPAAVFGSDGRMAGPSLPEISPRASKIS